ncbi:helix-turn-helix transcriptional regulator [Pseudomonas lalucatii]|uniref:Helix-turn-helix transcriptional regulator n=2 Tax=Pseudomonas lalucatii TaxID=1424203 RepID=A0ABS5PX34_9PSED|nr:helix-turn-helix transcriptional regulator [Pseudomonas lalucatii]MBS7724313.1 helix-turn-helix transcriptional regulator [Pseudomonas lalucatii]
MSAKLGIRLPFSASPLLRSHDLDEAEGLLNSHIEERRLQPCGRGQTDIHFTLQSLPQLKLFGAGFGRAVRVSSSPLACWHGILPLRGAVSSHPDGQRACAGELLMFTPGHEVDVVWHEGTQAIVLALDASLLVDHVMQHHQTEVTRLPAQAQLMGRQHPAVVSLGNLLRLVDSDTGNPSGLLTSPVGQVHMQYLFCENLVHLIPSLSALPQRSLLPGTVKRVVDFIQAHLDQPLSISQLVSVSGASRRSLEQAFRRYLGISPQRYIQNCRLRAIRELLQHHRQGEVQLSELAFRWGFAQPSHFTTAYKKAFGELPSHTLSRQS